MLGQSYLNLEKRFYLFISGKTMHNPALGVNANEVIIMCIYQGSNKLIYSLVGKVIKAKFSPSLHVFV